MTKKAIKVDNETIIEENKVKNPDFEIIYMTKLI